MFEKRFRHSVFLFLVGTAGHAAEPLTLDVFVQGILERNPGVQRILAQEAVAEGRLTSSQGVDDPVLGSSGSVSRNEFDQIFGFEAKRSNDVALRLSLDRTFSKTGTRLSASYGNQYTDRSPPLPLGATYYQPSVTLRLTQPLLKNARGIQDRLDITLSESNLEIARLDSREQLESYITRLAALYLDWYREYRETQILGDALNNVREQEKLVRLKVQRQVAEPHELLRVQETREDYTSRWRQALGRSQGLSGQVDKQLNLASSEREPVHIPANPEGSVLLATRPERAPDYLTRDSRLKAILDELQAQQEQLVAASSNNRKANLDLTLGYTRHGLDSGFGAAHGNAFDRDDASLMLEYRYPMGNRRARGDYHAQSAARRQVKADAAQRLIDARAALTDLTAQERQWTEALAAADRKIALAKRKLVEERRLYNIGKLDLFELLQDATTQLESRLNRTRLYVQLQKIRLSIGELLDNNLRRYQPGNAVG